MVPAADSAGCMRTGSLPGPRARRKQWEKLVGAVRFELTTPCAQGRCATGLRYAPTFCALLILDHFLNLRYCPACPNRPKNPPTVAKPHQKLTFSVSKPGRSSLALRFSFRSASRFICSFICEYFLNAFASPCRSNCVTHSSATPPALKGSRTGFRDEPEHHRSAAKLAPRLCKKCSASSRKTCPERSGGRAPLAEKGCGERGGSPCPRLSTQWPGARIALRIEGLTSGWPTFSRNTNPALQAPFCHEVKEFRGSAWRLFPSGANATGGEELMLPRTS